MTEKEKNQSEIEDQLMAANEENALDIGEDFAEDEAVSVEAHAEQARLAFDELELNEATDFVEDTEELDAEEFLAMDDEEGKNVSEEAEMASEEESEASDVSGTELEGFESAAIEDEVFVGEEELQSIIESILFATDKPQSVAVIKQAFKGTNVKTKDIKRAIDNLMIDYASSTRGVTLEEVNGGFQLRTKVDNMDFLRGMIKARPFKLSGPALEVLSIVAYKQPCIKHLVDEIRGVESGHLLRGLMDRSLINFAGKSDLPGKPMLYATTKKFLEIFGLRNLQELPSLSEIDELIPEGIGEEEEKETLDMVTDSMSEQVTDTYSQNEEELEKISETLSGIDTSSEFFEEEKRRAKAKRDAERAQDIREAMTVGEEVPNKDIKWLERYDAALAEEQAAAAQVQEVSQEESAEASVSDISPEDTEAEILALEEALEGEVLAEPAEVEVTEEEPSEELAEASEANTEDAEELMVTAEAMEPPKDLDL